mgnify:CR=1 FL=1|jgi:hypothetical protein
MTLYLHLPPRATGPAHHRAVAMRRAAGATLYYVPAAEGEEVVEVREEGGWPEGHAPTPVPVPVPLPSGWRPLI